MNRPTKLLLVDDAPTILTLLSNLFGKSHEVLKSSTLGEAREFLNSHDVDLVICDLNMPDGRGQELVSFMKADSRTSGLPIVVLSSNDNTSVKLELLRMGVDDYVLKPFNLEELSLRVENILKRAKKD